EESGKPVCAASANDASGKKTESVGKNTSPGGLNASFGLCGDAPPSNGPTIGPLLMSQLQNAVASTAAPVSANALSSRMSDKGGSAARSVHAATDEQIGRIDAKRAHRGVPHLVGRRLEDEARIGGGVQPRAARHLGGELPRAPARVAEQEAHVARRT